MLRNWLWARILCHRLKGDSVAQGKACRDLAAIGPDAVAPLCRVVSGKDVSAADRAADCLAQIGDKRAVPLLISVLTDHHETANRIAAANALGKLGDSRAIDALLSVLDDSDPPVRRSASYALGSLGSEKAIRGLVDQFYKHHDAQVAISSLCKIPGSRAANAIFEIASNLNAASATSQLLLQAACRLLRDNDPRGRELALALVIHCDPNNKSEMLRRLQETGWKAESPLEKAIEFIVTFNGGNLLFDRPAAYGKAEPGLVIPLSECLGHESPWLRTQAALALGVLGYSSAATPLISVLNRAMTETESDEPLLHAACRALGCLSEYPDVKRVAFEPLLAIAGRADGVGLASAAICLGKIGSKRAAPTLIKCLGRHNETHRSFNCLHGYMESYSGLATTLAEALGKLGDLR